MGISVVAGTTSTFDFQLKDDGVAKNLTGLTLGITSLAADGSSVLGGVVSLVDAATGKVRYTPVAADFTAARQFYSFRIKITDAGGLVSFYPDADPLVFQIVSP